MNTTITLVSPTTLEISYTREEGEYIGRTDTLSIPECEDPTKPVDMEKILLDIRRLVPEVIWYPTRPDKVSLHFTNGKRGFNCHMQLKKYVLTEQVKSLEEENQSLKRTVQELKDRMEWIQSEYEKQDRLNVEMYRTLQAHLKESQEYRERVQRRTNICVDPDVNERYWACYNRFLRSQSIADWSELQSIIPLMPYRYIDNYCDLFYGIKTDEQVQFISQYPPVSFILYHIKDGVISPENVKRVFMMCMRGQSSHNTQEWISILTEGFWKVYNM